jgi:hypothetical protein
MHLGANAGEALSHLAFEPVEPPVDLVEPPVDLIEPVVESLIGPRSALHFETRVLAQPRAGQADSRTTQ